MPEKENENVMEKMFGIAKEYKEMKKAEVKTDNNVLITGIGGFVGSHLANTLKDRNTNIVGIVRDSIPSDWLSDALFGCTILNGDIRNRDFMRRVIKHYDINVIYHIASFANVKQANNLVYETFDTNVMGTLSVLEACKNSRRFEQGDGKIIVLNTDKVYGEKLEATEDDKYDWSEPYATSKSCQGFISKMYREIYNLDVKSAHSCNIFGYDPFNDRLIPNTIKNCIKGKSPVIYNNDSSIREYIYIDDVVDALYMLTSDYYNKYAYNINTGFVYNQKDIVLKIIEYYNDINFENIEPTYADGKLPKQIQNESMKSINWNWAPQWSFDDGIRETVDNFLIYRYDWR